jgi:hypothetical protein
MGKGRDKNSDQREEGSFLTQNDFSNLRTRKFLYNP